MSEVLTHWGGATSVDPRVILTTLAVTENWPGKEIPDEAEVAHIKEEVIRIANQLSQHFYAYREQKSEYNYNAPTLSIANQLLSISDWQEWKEKYEYWFGTSVENNTTTLKSLNSQAVTTSDTITTTQALPSQGFMQWPWRQGYNWIPNGPHSYTGSGNPLSSIDVAYDWPRWGRTTYDVASAHAGYVSVLSRCEVRITNPNGWATNYYHMDDLQIQDGEWVDKNTVLGIYASDRSTALCSGGSSTGPHLHFSVLYNGVYQSIQGMTFGPYEVQVGRNNYDSNCDYAWLTDTRINQKICFWRRAENPVD